MERKILTAEDGMILTNGTVYGRVIYLADGADEGEWYAITESEYEAIMDSERVDEHTLEEEVQ